MEQIIELNNAAGGTIARYVVTAEYDAHWEVPVNLNPFGESEWFAVESEELMTRLDDFAFEQAAFMDQLNEVQ